MRGVDESAGPLIGVSTGFTDYGDYLGLAFTRPLVALGAMPVGVLYLETSEARRDLLERLDGLLLAGGRDLDPQLYGGARHPALTPQSPHRDQLELPLAREAIELGVPALGICRGLQVLNVALGGSLHPDHSALFGPAAAHPGGDWERWQLVVEAFLGGGKEPTHPSHSISVMAESPLSVAGRELVVNSYHHQSIDRLGHGVEVAAVAEDGVIEAIWVPDAPALCLGVQWELQEEWRDDARQRGVFGLLVDAAARRERSR
jgi:putative glutamine amidotransferase